MWPSLLAAGQIVGRASRASPRVLGGRKRLPHLLDGGVLAVGQTAQALEQIVKRNDVPSGFASVKTQYDATVQHLTPQ